MNIKLGSGTFGNVFVDPTDAKIACKKFKYLDDLIHEVMLTQYFLDSDKIITIRSFKLSTMVMKVDRWSCSLHAAISSHSDVLTGVKKLTIFKDVLVGLSHLQARAIIHSDLRSDNILVNLDTGHACIADLGISCLSKHANFKGLPDPYRPPRTARNKGHDMYSLCVTMLELFTSFRLRRDGPPPRVLRSRIRSSGISEKLKTSLIMMIPDNLAEAKSAKYIAEFMFDYRGSFKSPTIKLHKDRIGESNCEYIQTKVESLCITHNIKRGTRCASSLLNYLNDPSVESITPSEFPAYIASSMIIFSAVFSSGSFDERKALALCKPAISAEQLHGALVSMIMNRNYVNMVLRAGVDQVKTI